MIVAREPTVLKLRINGSFFTVRSDLVSPLESIQKGKTSLNLIFWVDKTERDKIFAFGSL